MAEPVIATTRLAGKPGRGDLLVVGPSLGTAVVPLWSDAARLLGDRFDVVGWDLPGHGSSPATTEPFSVQDLAAAVEAETARLMADAGPGRQAWYAGVSLGGAVGLALVTGRTTFAGVAVLASGAKIGEDSAWRERAALVRQAGTPVMVEPSSRRWFAPGFIDRQPERAGALLSSLHGADRESYALACEALAEHDLRDALGAVTQPVLVVAGAEDGVITPEHAKATAAALPAGELVVLEDTGHLPPAESPEAVAELLARLCGRGGAA